MQAAEVLRDIPIPFANNYVQAQIQEEIMEMLSGCVEVQRLIQLVGATDPETITSPGSSPQRVSEQTRSRQQDAEEDDMTLFDWAIRQRQGAQHRSGVEEVHV